MAKPIPICPDCASTDIQKSLGGLTGSVTSLGLLVVGFFFFCWFFVPLAIVRMYLKSHRCRSCGNRFDWPPFWLRKFDAPCPACGQPIRGLTIDYIDETASCANCGQVFTIFPPPGPAPPPLP